MEYSIKTEYCSECHKKSDWCDCDGPLHTKKMKCLPCAYTEQETCPEVFSMDCMIWTMDPIEELNIQPGDKLSQVIQKLILAALNPGCVNPANTCQSVLDLVSTLIGNTTIGVSWLGMPNATSYVTNYKASSSNVWLLNTAVLAPNVNDTIGGLQPNTNYDIKINAICPSGACMSLTIQVKTSNN